MKNRIIKLLFLFLFTIAFSTNYYLISGKEDSVNTSLFSVISITTANAEDPIAYPLWEEACFPCTNSNGQNGIKLICELSWAICFIDMRDCGYGYC